MTRPRDLDPELISRYLSGETTPGESALVRLWAADPRNGAELAALRRAWNHSFLREPSIDVDAGWRTVSAAMRAQSHSDEAVRDSARDDAPRRDVARNTGERAELRLHRTDSNLRGGHGHVLRPTMARVARSTSVTRFAMMTAAAAVVIGAGITALRGMWSPESSVSAGNGQVARTTRDFVARPGQRALIDLADGTHIVLAPASHLHASLPVGPRGTRELTLDGEAMFTVAHDASRPFVVHSRYGTTVDVGTSFAVRAYAGERYRVVVRDGRVALGGNGAALLIAGDVASRSDDGTMHIAHGQNAAGLLDWTTGRLTFQHERLGDLIPELERWCGVTIHIATPSLRDRIITGQLDTESPSEAMDAIGRTLGAQHSIHGTHVTFSLSGEGR